MLGSSLYFAFQLTSRNPLDVGDLGACRDLRGGSRRCVCDTGFEALLRVGVVLEKLKY